MDHESQFTQNFCCAKCRGREAVSRTAHLPGGILPLTGGKYLLVSCTMCGYTETYNMAVFAKSEECRDRLVESGATPAPD